MKCNKTLALVLLSLFSGPIVIAQSGGVAWFDAPTESYVDLGSTDSSNCYSDLQTDDKLSVTMWVKWDDKDASNVGNWANRLTYADSTGNGDNGTFWCQHNNKNDRFEFAVQTTNGRDYIFSNTNPQEGQWYHVAQVYDGSEMRIYVDGVQEGQMTKTGNLNVSSKSKLNMGRWPNAANNHRFFDGSMDEISIWDRALSQQEIDSIMNDPESVTSSSYDTTGLIGYWDFDDYKVDDKSPCNNDGSSSGSFSTVPAGSDVTRSTAPGDCSDPNNWDNGVPNDTLTAIVEDSMYLTQPISTKNLVIKDSLNDNGDTITIKSDLINKGQYIPSGGAIEFNGSTTDVRHIYANRDLKVDKLLVDVPSEVSLDSGVLQIKDELKVASGTLNIAEKKITLLSDSSGTARIAPIPTGSEIKGQVAVQRHLQSGNAGWIDMAAPNRDSVTLAEWDDDIYLSGKTTGGFDDGCSWSGSCFWSVKRSDSTGSLVDVTSTSTPLENGRGYELFIGDDGGINTMNSDTTVTVKGRIRKPGSYTIDVNDNGWSLVANPFASPVKFDQLGTNNLDPSYYVAAATGSYEFYNKNTGNSSHPDVGNVIASSQGFWVKGTGSNASITFKQSHKTNNAASFSKNGKPDFFTLRLTDASNGLSSGIVLHFKGDSSKFEPVPHKATPVKGSPDLHTRSKNEGPVRSRFLGTENERTLVPLKVVPKEQGTYTFKAEVPEALPYEKVVLIDSANGNRHELSKGMAQVMLSSSDSGSSRFFLEFSDDPVSVQLHEPASEAISVRSEKKKIQVVGVPAGKRFRVSVHDARGKQITPIQEVRFNGSGQRAIGKVPEAGIYFVNLQNSRERITKKVLVR